jgi:hypothetical protein
MHQCRLVTKRKDAGTLPESKLFLVAIPHPGDLVITARCCYLVEAVRRRGRARPGLAESPPDEPRVVLQVRRAGTAASTPALPQAASL